MSLTAKQMAARDEGSEAFEEGKSRNTNPYSMLSEKDLWQCWDDGWEEAETESEEEDDEDNEGGS